MPDAGPLTILLDSGGAVLDGGLATELERRGVDLHDPLWSAKALVDTPETIVDVHRAYFEAGADVAITA
ncbi:MAG: homocysteine S-methyltransferase family protein, partial [Acidimicrobiia bacterium]|nr:homocysteine S-methyltransferase family protein [Acidimicrobiia bacterium]